MSVATLERKFAKVKTVDLQMILNDERRELGLQDLYYHNNVILGYKDMREQPHREMCKFIQTWPVGISKKLLVGPRDCFKSCMDVVGYSTQLIAQNPLVKIYIVSELESNAKAYLTEIQSHLTSNQVYQDTYHHLYDNYNFDVLNTEALNLTPKNPVKGQMLCKEHTIDVGGIGTPKVGMHYDYIFFVDPHSERNVQTEAQLKKVIVYYRLLNSIKKAVGGRLIIEMTRWHFLDLANHVLAYEKGQFDEYIRSAYNNDGSLYFPDRLTADHLSRQLETMGTYLYSCNYLASPQSDATKTFKLERAAYYKELPDGLEKWVICDPSIDEKENADDFALLGLGVERKETNAQYLLGKEKINRKMPAQAVGSIIAFLETYCWDQPKYRVAIETVAFQRIYKFELQRELSKRGKPFEIVELKPGGRSKKSRIMGLQPFWEAGKLLVRAGNENAPSPDNDLLLQFDNFPYDKDDFIDSWAYILDIIKPKKEYPSTVNEAQFYRQKIKRSMGRQTGMNRRFS